MNVATIIRDQIHAMDPSAMPAWGAKDLIAFENGLQFKTSGLVKNKGLVRITLNASDLYDVEFGKIRKFEFTQLQNVEDVFVEDLISVIDEMVG